MRVAYFTPSSFRTVNAGALRNVGVAKALASAGHVVAIFTSDGPADVIASEWAKILRDPALTITNSGRPRGSLLSRFARYFGGGTFRLSGTLEEFQPDAIVLYNTDPVAIRRLHRYSSAHNLPFTLDVTEWLNAADLPGGRLGPFAVVNEAVMRGLARRQGRVMAVSTRLAAHLGSDGSPTIVVPPLFEIRPRDTDSLPRKRIDLVTTGTDLRPRGKDVQGLALIVEALSITDPDGIHFHLHVVGAIDDATRSRIENRLTHKAVTIHGRLDWHDSLEVVGKASFTVVLRSPTDKRSSYGFPSKVPESLLLGTPILCNLFSDLADHLVDGVNAIVSPQATVDSLVDTLRRLPPSLDRNAVRSSAQHRYSPESWGVRVSEFVLARS